MKKTAKEKKVTQKDIEDDINSLRKFVTGKLNCNYHVVSQYGNWILISKLVNLNIHITNDLPLSFQPLAIDRALPYTIITLLELCTELGEPSISEKDRMEVNKLLSKGVEKIKIYPDSIVLDRLNSIGRPPFS